MPNATSTATATAVNWVEQGYVPDRVVRLGIRRLLRERLVEIADGDAEASAQQAQAFFDGLGDAPLALVPEKANEQHYEVPAAFFAEVLGTHRKYSSCWWPEGVNTLDEAEAASLAETCARAGLQDGQHVLELGCGWGSLTLWMAAHYPGSSITAVSNSASQREHIEAEALKRGLNNVHVITRDINAFETDARYDRIVSVEMFEHLRNWPAAFVERDASDWMSRHFFSGGMMPSDDLALHCQRDLKILRRWRWDGRHYQKTSEAWLANMDAKRDAVWPVLEATYGPQNAQVWWMRWRLFFMSVAELFGYDDGQQWWVSHYLFERA